MKRFSNSVMLGGVEVVNLTPHPVVIYLPDNTQIEIKPEGLVPRVDATDVEVRRIGGVPILEKEFGEVKDLPEPCEGVIFIVSSLVAQACRQRRDLVVPAHPVRDGEGRIIGCRGLARIV